MRPHVSNTSRIHSCSLRAIEPLIIRVCKSLFLTALRRKSACRCRSALRARACALGGNDKTNMSGGGSTFAMLSSDALVCIGVFASVEDLLAMACANKQTHRALTRCEMLFERLYVTQWHTCPLQIKCATWKHTLLYAMRNRCLVPHRTLEDEDAASAAAPGSIESVYNANYRCRVNHVVLSRGTVEVHFAVRGDMSLGELQPPDSSQLCFKWQNSIGDAPRSLVKDCVKTVKPSRVQLEAGSNVVSHIHGRLVYARPPIVPTDGGVLFQTRIGWTYGMGGYSAVWFDLSGEHVLSQRLSHVL